MAEISFGSSHPVGGITARLPLVAFFAFALALGCMLLSVASADAIADEGDGTFHYNGVQYKILSDTGVKSVQVGNGVDPAIDGGIESVDIPRYVRHDNVRYVVTAVAPYAFSECAGLTSVTIQNTVASIGDYAFYMCTDLISAPSPSATIGAYAFYGCQSLSSYRISGSVTSIGDHAFDGTSHRSDIEPAPGVVMGHEYVAEYKFSKDRDVCKVTLTCVHDPSDSFSEVVDTVIRESQRTVTATYMHGAISYSKTIEYSAVGDIAVDYTILSGIGWFVAVAGYLFFARKPFE